MADLKQVVSEWQEFLAIPKTKCKFALEIGTFRGKGTAGLCGVADKVITLDIDDRRVSRPARSIFIQGDSHSKETLEKVKTIIGKDGLDLLFIDGDHSYEGVKVDFELYAPLVNSGGVIGLHDIADCPKHRRKKCNVFEFWAEIKEQYQTKELIHDGSWGGIGVVWR